MCLGATNALTDAAARTRNATAFMVTCGERSGSWRGGAAVEGRGGARAAVESRGGAPAAVEGRGSARRSSARPPSHPKSAAARSRSKDHLAGYGRRGRRAGSDPRAKSDRRNVAGAAEVAAAPRASPETAFSPASAPHIVCRQLRRQTALLRPLASPNAAKLTLFIAIVRRAQPRPELNPGSRRG